eukprot:IDg12783t1
MFQMKVGYFYQNKRTTGLNARRLLTGTWRAPKIETMQLLYRPNQDPGYIIRPSSLEVEEATTVFLRNIRHPRSLIELRSFLGHSNVYRRFIRNFCNHASPLFGLLKGRLLLKQFPELNKDQTQYYQRPIEAVTNSFVLSIPKLGSRSVLTLMPAIIRSVARYFKRTKIASGN